MRRTLAVLMLAASTFGALSVVADARPPGTNDEIRARLKPIGTLCKAGDPCAAASASAGSTGTGLAADAIYNQYCVACHGTGAAGAPKFGDKAAWAPRIGQGLETLVTNAINGKNAMPPRGTCGSCSDDEIKATVQHIVDASK